MRPVTKVVAAAAAALITVTSASAAAADRSNSHLQILVLSNRADVLSGGDALVEVVLPAGTDASRLRVHLASGEGSRDVGDAFAVRPDGRVLGLVDGLPVGRSGRIAAAGGRRTASTARIGLS